MIGPRRQRRNGALYIVVLGVATIVAVSALAASMSARLLLRTARDEADVREAALQARSGVEYALKWLNANNDWRTQLTSGVERGPIYPGQTSGASFTWSVVDVDGDLADDTRDHAVLRSVGSAGAAYAALEVDIEPEGRWLTCLEAAVHAAGDIELEDSATLTGSGIASANDDIDLSDATCDLDAEAVDKLKGDDYEGAKWEGAPARETPSEHVFEHYVRRGTPIDIDDIPSAYGTRTLTKRVLSPELNPFGEPNPWGIYTIDCGGQTLQISRSRIVGTLVLLNPGLDTKISDVAILQPAALNYPSLLVDGDLKIDLYDGYPFFGSGAYLSELSNLYNYNPVGAPYDDEVDADIYDTRPATLDGIVYATGTVTITDNTAIRGCLIANNVVVESGEELKVSYRAYAKDYPPPGFSAGQGVRVLPGSWRRASR